jgi:thiol-disulfide isomerase/thioredoxin
VPDFFYLWPEIKITNMLKLKYLLPLVITGVIIVSLAFLAPGKRSSGSSVETANEAPVGTKVGNLAPELKYASPEGQEIALSSLRGKVVLIDFWAAWCPPCRAENPNLVSAYNNYKDKKFQNGKGFTVYSLSLDRSKESWMAAIKNDKLVWPYHVSDLGGWNAEGAKIYGVNSIPTNYLLDGDGIIIAVNLRGEALHRKLAELAK